MIASRWQDFIGEGLFTKWKDMMVALGMQIPGVTIRNKQRLGHGTYLAQLKTSLVGIVPLTVYRDGMKPIRTFDRSMVMASPVTKVFSPFDVGGAMVSGLEPLATETSGAGEIGARAVVTDQPLSWAPEEYLPYAEIQWNRVEGASRYRLILATGGSAGVTIAVFVDRGDAEYFVFRTFALVDEQIYGIIIEPEDAAGQGPDGGLSVVISPVLYPTAELIDYTYDPESSNLTVSAR